MNYLIKPIKKTTSELKIHPASEKAAGIVNAPVPNIKFDTNTQATCQNSSQFIIS